MAEIRDLIVGRPDLSRRQILDRFYHRRDEVAYIIDHLDDLPGDVKPDSAVVAWMARVRATKGDAA